MTEEMFSVFSDLSIEMDNKYKNDPNFIQRMLCWKTSIDKYLHPGALVYDLGCGSGIFSFYAASRQARVTGFDGSDGMIGFCNQKLEASGERQALDIHFVREALPLKDAAQYPQADLIICSSMFEYIHEKEKMIECYRNLLKVGGILLISVPNRKSVYRILEKTSYRIIGKPSYFKYVNNCYTEQELITEFKKHYMEPMEKSYFANNYLFSGLLKTLLPESFYSNLLLVAFQKKK